MKHLDVGILLVSTCLACMIMFGQSCSNTKYQSVVAPKSESPTKPIANQIVIADMDRLLKKLRVQEIPGIGSLGGWNRKPTIGEFAALGGEHITAQQLAEIRRADALAAAKIRQADAAAAAKVRQETLEGLWLLCVYSLSVLVAFIGFVAAFYFRQWIFLALPVSGLGVSFTAYFFLHAFIWLAWIVVGMLVLIALAGVWYIVRKGGIMQVVAKKAVTYAEEQKSHMPKKAREAMHTFAKKNHPAGISAVINDLRGKTKA